MNLDGFAAFPQRLSDDLPSKGTVDEKTKRSGSFEPELAADGLFDLFCASGHNPPPTRLSILRLCTARLQPPWEFLS
jgi:hypothetical protein